MGLPCSGSFKPAPGLTVYVVAEDAGVLEIGFGKPRRRTVPNERHPVVSQALRQLKAYFHGTLRKFDLPLAMEGTQFQSRVWKALCRIPYGQTRSYSEIARAAGSARAARAVGSANHANPIAIVVPCHRVIHAGGGLGGYGGGLPLKRMLLELEAGTRQRA